MVGRRLPLFSVVLALVGGGCAAGEQFDVYDDFSTRPRLEPMPTYAVGSPVEFTFRSEEFRRAEDWYGRLTGSAFRPVNVEHPEPRPEGGEPGTAGITGAQLIGNFLVGWSQDLVIPVQATGPGSSTLEAVDADGTVLHGFDIRAEPVACFELFYGGRLEFSPTGPVRIGGHLNVIAGGHVWLEAAYFSAAGERLLGAGLVESDSDRALVSSEPRNGDLLDVEADQEGRETVTLVAAGDLSRTLEVASVPYHDIVSAELYVDQTDPLIDMSSGLACVDLRAYDGAGERVFAARASWRADHEELGQGALLCYRPDPEATATAVTASISGIELTATIHGTELIAWSM